MRNALRRIREITNVISDSSRTLSSLQQEVMEYSLLIRQTLLAERAEFIEQRELNDPSILDVGEALTPWHAASCVDDRIRTAAFIRGCVRAVEFALESCPDRPLHLLEVGCGPLGTLILPLLSRFGSDELEITVIDLHQESIDSFRQIVKTLGLSHRLRKYVCADATEVRLDSKVHLALSETMCAALSSEPQVAIARSLVGQYPEAILLPKSIRVNMALINWESELQEFPPRVKERVEVGQIFELNAKAAHDFHEVNGRLAAARLKIPELGRGYTPSVTTTVEVFNGIIFEDYDSQITTPVQMPVGVHGINQGDELQFAYRLGKTPGLEWTINKKGK